MLLIGVEYRRAMLRFIVIITRRNNNIRMPAMLRVNVDFKARSGLNSYQITLNQLSELWHLHDGRGVKTHLKETSLAKFYRQYTGH